jgi:hypothetical protein
MFFGLFACCVLVVLVATSSVATAFVSVFWFGSAEVKNFCQRKRELGGLNLQLGVVQFPSPVLWPAPCRFWLVLEMIAGSWVDKMDW